MSFIYRPAPAVTTFFPVRIREPPIPRSTVMLTGRPGCSYPGQGARRMDAASRDRPEVGLGAWLAGCSRVLCCHPAGAGS